MLLLAVSCLLSLPCGANETAIACSFDHQNLNYLGNPATQAACLLRPVRPSGELAAPLAALPPLLASLVGHKPALSIALLSAYLRTHGIAAAQIGGALEDPISHAMAGDPRAPLARYFVIHDTSTPALGNAEFPADIDALSWPDNNLDRWLEGERSRAHVFISRTGNSVTPVNFSEPWRATKFEMQDTLLRRKGLFLHIELVQPRRDDPAGLPANGLLAPIPGFTPAQYARLALVYAAASLRSGEWLIPAYHAVLDAGRADGHDDPQNFSLDAFVAALEQLLAEIRGTVASEAFPE
jgi:hypothetical protein